MPPTTLNNWVLKWAHFWSQISEYKGMASNPLRNTFQLTGHAAKVVSA